MFTVDCIILKYVTALLMTSMAQHERKKNWQISLASRQSLHSLRHGDQCPEDQADDNTSGINTEIKISGQKLETVTSFKYLGSVITDEGFKPEILCMVAQTTVALTRSKPVWNDRSISLSSKIQLMRSPCQIRMYHCTALSAVLTEFALYKFSVLLSLYWVRQ